MSSITIDKTENMEPGIQPHASDKYTDLQLLKPMMRPIGYSSNPTSPGLWQSWDTRPHTPHPGKVHQFLRLYCGQLYLLFIH